MPDSLAEWFSIAKDVALFFAAAIGIWNALKIKEVHKLTNSMASRTEALARSTGLAEGNLAGRKEQIAERKEEKKP